MPKAYALSPACMPPRHKQKGPAAFPFPGMVVGTFAQLILRKESIAQGSVQHLQPLFQTLAGLGKQAHAFHFHGAFQAGGVAAAQQDGGKAAANPALGKLQRRRRGFSDSTTCTSVTLPSLFFSLMYMPSVSTSASDRSGAPMVQVGVGEVQPHLGGRAVVAGGNNTGFHGLYLP